jgi:hypothetical protein
VSAPGGRLAGRVTLVTGGGVRHPGAPADVAYCAVFPATEASNSLTGQVLQPNGGWVMA